MEEANSVSASVETPQQRHGASKPSSSSRANRYCAVILWTLIAIWLSGVALFAYANGELFPVITEPAFLGEQIEQPLVLHDARLPVRWPLPLKDHDFSGRTHTYSTLTLNIASHHGRIEITLRPDLSEGSVRYLYDLVQQGCARCYFHRKVPSMEANHGFVLGTMANHEVPLNTVPGNCPDTLKDKDPKCSVWNTKQCGCHGPVLAKGMVGWVEGTYGGPDFFINTQSAPLEQLGTKYTVFGEVVGFDDESVDGFDALERIMKIKGTLQKAQAFPEKIDFRLSLE
jgi:cyclophilin family peptidyl-prolyl cis-trans isomerase